MLLWNCSIRCKNTDLIILARAKHKEMIEMQWMKVWSERLLWGCLAHGSAIEVVVNSKKYSVSECGTPASSQLLRRGSFFSFYLELHVHTCTAALKFLEAVKSNSLLIAEKFLKFFCCNFLKQELPKCSVHYAFVNNSERNFLFEQLSIDKKWISHSPLTIQADWGQAKIFGRLYSYVWD